MTRWIFWRLHIPTGKKTLGELEAWDRSQLLRSLDTYNRQGAGLWQYWSAS